jgi:hypothetical protein
VFTTLTASAPSSAATWAIAAMSGNTGESFTTRGRAVAARQRRTSSPSARGSAPNSSPPACVFGQDALISKAVIAASPLKRVITAVVVDDGTGHVHDDAGALELRRDLGKS